jgi:polyisoprenoid-binding protein YceI
LVLLGSAALLACQSAAPPPATPAPAVFALSSENAWAALYANLAADGGTILRLDAQQSTVRIFAFRGGRAPKLGHNHVLSAPEFSGFLYLPPGGPAGARFDLEFRLDRLELDDPRIRAKLGASFAAELTPAEVGNTRAHMLGADNLQADRFPFVRIHSLEITGEGSTFAAGIAVEMHGQKKTLWVPLTVEGLPHRITVTGAFILRQSDFGVQPYSALAGLIAVQDAVLVEFTLAGG